jgi:hypothetical protein
VNRCGVDVKINIAAAPGAVYLFLALDAVLCRLKTQGPIEWTQKHDQSKNGEKRLKAAAEWVIFTR